MKRIIVLLTLLASSFYAQAQLTPRTGRFRPRPSKFGTTGHAETALSLSGDIRRNTVSAAQLRLSFALNVGWELGTDQAYRRV